MKVGAEQGLPIEAIVGKNIQKRPPEARLPHVFIPGVTHKKAEVAEPKIEPDVLGTSQEVNKTNQSGPIRGPWVPIHRGPELHLRQTNSTPINTLPSITENAT